MALGGTACWAACLTVLVLLAASGYARGMHAEACDLVAGCQRRQRQPSVTHINCNRFWSAFPCAEYRNETGMLNHLNDLALGRVGQAMR